MWWWRRRRRRRRVEEEEEEGGGGGGGGGQSECCSGSIGIDRREGKGLGYFQENLDRIMISECLK
jgi:hypothetical protein